MRDGTALWTVWVAMRTEQRDIRGRPSLINTAVVQPAVFLLITASVRTPDPARATWLISAVALTAVWSSTVWIAGGVLRRERTAGTLARCVTSVRPASLILLGKSLGATVYSMAAIVVSTLAAALVLGLPVATANPGWILVAVLVAALSATALGMLLSCLFLVTRNGLAWSSALMYPVFLLGGLLIPHDVLPQWVSWLPSIVSLRWIHDFLTAAAGSTVRFAPLGIALLLTAVYFGLATLALRRSVDAARKQGTLDLS